MKRYILLAVFLSLCMAIQAAVTNSIITIDLSNKTATVSAVIAIRETVNVSLVNIGTSAATNLCLRLVLTTNAYANATNFVSNGVSTAFGALDLNTTELVNYFSGYNPTASKKFSMAVWDTALGTLLLNDYINIQNNPYDPTMPGPSPLGVLYLIDAPATNGPYARWSNSWMIVTNLVGPVGPVGPDNFPLTNNVSLGGFTMSNGTFAGNGPGLTNLTELDPSWVAASNGVVYDSDTNGWIVSAHLAWLTNEPLWIAASNGIVYDSETNGWVVLAHESWITNESLWIGASNGVVYKTETNGWTVTGHEAWITNESLWIAASNGVVYTSQTNGWVTSAHLAWLTNEASWIAASNGVVYTNDPALTNDRNPTAHNQGYDTITNAPWLTNVVGYVPTNDTRYLAALTNNQTGVTLGLASGSTISDASASNQPVSLHQLQDAASSYITWQFWSGSNSSIMGSPVKAMRLISEGNPPLGTNVVTVTSNGQYITYCSLPAGLTSLKAGLYQVNANMWLSGSGGGGPLVNLSAEIYIRATNGVETEITAVSGTSAQALTVNRLEFIYSLNVTTNVAMNVTDSVLVKFKTSGRVGTTVIAYIDGGFLSAPVPSGQFALQGSFVSHTNNVSNPHAVTAAQAGAASNADFNAVSNAFAIVLTNYFPLQSGLNVSNRVAVLETNTAPVQSYLSTSNSVKILLTNTASLAQGATADLALPKSFTNTGIMTAVQITGGSPTNGAVFIATNTTGQGKWSGPCAFFANLDTDFSFTNTVARTVVWSVERYNYGGNWNGTTFTAPVNGVYAFEGAVIVSIKTGTTVGDVWPAILVNGAVQVDFCVLQGSYNSNNGYAIGDFSHTIYLTNNSVVAFQIAGTLGHTNILWGTGLYNRFSGILIRELP